MKPTTHTYHHRFRNGTRATATVSTDPPAFNVEWSRKPTRRVLAEYTAWRHTVLDDFTSRTGLTILLIDLR